MAEAKPAEELTIDELARRTGMTVRNIRAHQSRGLLPAPQVRGRTGFYGPEHESRIGLIRELQADGYKLEAISRLLESAGGSSEEVLRFTRTMKAPFEDEQPQIVSAEELAQRWEAGDAAPSLLRKAEKLGILRALPDGNFEELSPRLGQASGELARLGIPAETALDVAAQLRRHSEGVAKTFVELFVEQVWKPFEDQGSPEHDLPAVRDALERLRPLASDALLAMFQLVMTEAVEERMGREVERIRERDGGGRRRRR
jgi:DNA-binding transcriptional MerR regulator